jgi:putative ABC transport system substrate-binding protein
MRRREFVTLLGGAAASSVACPLAAYAQQRAMPVIGFLYAGVRLDDARDVAAFRRGLHETGFVEGQNIAIEYRYAEDQLQRLPALAADLVERRVAVIAASARAGGSAKAATATISIVFMSGADPVRTGLVASLNRPDGNVTGVTLLSADLTAKRLGLLHDLAPQAGSIAILLDRTNQTGQEFQLQEAQTAGRNIGRPNRRRVGRGRGRFRRRVHDRYPRRSRRGHGLCQPFFRQPP